MDDIVDRLRNPKLGGVGGKLVWEAADEIERLRQEVHDTRAMYDKLFRAAKAVDQAIAVKGPRPDVHDAEKRRLQHDWPTLWNALHKLRLRVI